MKAKNILITGPPGCGKSTLVERVIARLSVKAVGFTTREIREGGSRVGFSVDTLDGQSEVLAHIRIRSPYRVGRYGVRIEAIEKVAVPSLKASSADVLILVDEIGKMECLSEAFRNGVLEILNSPNCVLATIAVRGDPFIESLKRRGDVSLISVSPSNRDSLVESVLESIIGTLARSAGMGQKMS